MRSYFTIFNKIMKIHTEFSTIIFFVSKILQLMIELERKKCIRCSDFKSAKLTGSQKEAWDDQHLSKFGEYKANRKK